MNDAHINPAKEEKEKKAFKYNFTPTGNDSLESQTLCKQYDKGDYKNCHKDDEDRQQYSNVDK